VHISASLKLFLSSLRA